MLSQLKCSNTFLIDTEVELFVKLTKKKFSESNENVPLIDLFLFYACYVSSCIKSDFG